MEGETRGKRVQRVQRDRERGRDRWWENDEEEDMPEKMEKYGTMRDDTVRYGRRDGKRDN